MFYNIKKQILRCSRYKPNLILKRIISFRLKILTNPQIRNLSMCGSIHTLKICMPTLKCEAIKTIIWIRLISLNTQNCPVLLMIDCIIFFLGSKIRFLKNHPIRALLQKHHHLRQQEQEMVIHRKMPKRNQKNT